MKKNGTNSALARKSAERSEEQEEKKRGK